MVSLLVVQIIKYGLGVLVVAMESRIRVQSRNPVKYVTAKKKKLLPFLKILFWGGSLKMLIPTLFCVVAKLGELHY